MRKPNQKTKVFTLYYDLTSTCINAVRFAISAESENADTDRFENGMPDDFSFIQSIALSIQATIDNESRSEIVAILEAGDPQLTTASRVLNLDTTGIDILPYLEAPGGYQIQVSATGSAPPDDVVFDGELGYRVGVGFR